MQDFFQDFRQGVSQDYSPSSLNEHDFDFWKSAQIWENQ